MNIATINILDKEYESFSELLEIINSNPQFKIKVITLLKLNPSERRIILHYWLDQMKNLQSCENLRRALSSLTKEKVSAEMIKIIINQQKNSGGKY